MPKFVTSDMAIKPDTTARLRSPSLEMPMPVSTLRLGPLVARLIKSERSAPRQFNAGKSSPGLLRGFFTRSAGLFQRKHFGIEIIGHQIKFMHVVLIGWMNRHFRWRKPENQPPLVNIHIFELQDILEERFVRFGILGINDDVCAVDHASAPCLAVC